jgi:general secretion pathway protein I
MVRRRGFTLLEVMVAMAILAMGMTMLLSSQAGLFAAAKRVQDETYAASLMRCKMSEVEQQLLEDGFSLIEQNDSGPCCEDFEGNFNCEWTIQTVELPQPAPFSDSEEFGEEGADDGSEAFDSGASPFGSPLGDAQAISPMSGDALAGVEGMGDLAGTLGESASGGGMIGMALSLGSPRGGSSCRPRLVPTPAAGRDRTRPRARRTRGGLGLRARSAGPDRGCRQAGGRASYDVVRTGMTTCTY